MERHNRSPPDDFPRLWSVEDKLGLYIPKQKGVLALEGELDISPRRYLSGKLKSLYWLRTGRHTPCSSAAKQHREKIELLGSEYQDFNLVFAGALGLLTEASTINAALRRLIKENDRPPVVFHSFRHASITYKLKLNGGDIKAVQGDSGHSQVKMVTDIYSHILDDDRKNNAQLFQEAFYDKKDTKQPTPSFSLPEGISPETLEKMLASPEIAALLGALAKNM